MTNVVGDSPQDGDVNEQENGVQKEGEKMNGEIPSCALPPCVNRFLESSKEIETDHEYFEALVAVETLRSMTHKLFQSVTGSMACVRSAAVGHPDSKIVVRGLRLGEMLQDLLKKLESKRATQLDRMKKRPILETLLNRLEATELQKKVFRHAVAKFSGMTNTYSLGEYEIVESLNHVSLKRRYFCMAHIRELFAEDGASLTTLMPMVDDESSKWLTEQLYVRSGPLVNFVGLDDRTIRALMGLEITPVEYRSLGSSLLQKILSEDDVFQNTPTGKAIRNQIKTEEACEASNGISNEKKPPSFFAQAMEATHTTDGARGIKKDRIFDILSIAAEKERKKPEIIAKPPLVADSAAVKSSSSEEEEDAKLDGADEKSKVADEFGPYKSELAYLDDQVTLMRRESNLAKLKLSLEDRKLDDDDLMDSQGVDKDVATYFDQYGDFVPVSTRQKVMGRTPTERRKEEKKAERLERVVKQFREKIRIRLAASRLATGRDFRLEQLCAALNLEKFEKYCLLEMLKSVIVPDDTPKMKSRLTEVGKLIENFCCSLEERMNCRRFFYKSGTLIREGILTLSQQDFMTDLSHCHVELDRRLFDYLVGLDTEMSEIVDGSHLYLPTVELDDVVIPAETKKRVCDAVLSFEEVKNKYYEYEIDKKITYGLGQVLLFYGNSGTGKTMLANAVAKKLNKKVLLVNFPNLGTNESGAILKYLFREARINRAVLFFDECESLFLDRSKGGSSVNMILTELERFDGLCILATNRAHDLDEAMHRRISLAIEFRKPDHILRQEIWKTLQPPKVPLEEDIELDMISKKYELTGGLIKNAWLQSLGLMVQRGGDKISQDDLMQAAGEQVIGQLTLEDFDRRVIPSCGLESMVLAPAIKDSLCSIVQYTKAQSVLFGQWGFDKIHRSTCGISALFTGLPGTGKTMAAEAIGFDLARPLLVVNVAELVSKWVGETGKNIQAVFADAKKKDAVLVFDEAEGLFGARSEAPSSSSRHDTMNVGLLLQYIENHPGVCIVITNMKHAIDEAFFRRFRFVLDFEMPNAHEREALWKLLIPLECPMASDVSLKDLALRFPMCGGDIKNSLLRAATHAALRSNEANRKVTMSDLSAACEAERLKTGDCQDGTLAMYS